MGLRTRIALLLCLAAAAVYTGGEALKRLEPAQTELPEEICLIKEVTGLADYKNRQLAASQIL